MCLFVLGTLNKCSFPFGEPTQKGVPSNNDRPRAILSIALLLRSFSMELRVGGKFRLGRNSATLRPASSRPNKAKRLPGNHCLRAGSEPVTGPAAGQICPFDQKHWVCLFWREPNKQVLVSLHNNPNKGTIDKNKKKTNIPWFSRCLPHILVGGEGWYALSPWNHTLTPVQNQEM